MFNGCLSICKQIPQDLREFSSYSGYFVAFQLHQDIQVHELEVKIKNK